MVKLVKIKYEEKLLKVIIRKRKSTFKGTTINCQ